MTAAVGADAGPAAVSETGGSRGCVVGWEVAGDRGSVGAGVGAGAGRGQQRAGAESQLLALSRLTAARHVSPAPEPQAGLPLHFLPGYRRQQLLPFLLAPH